MGKILLTVLVGAAVAGVVYYFYDKEGAEKLMGNIKDSASDTFGKITDNIGKAGSKANKMAGASSNA